MIVRRPRLRSRSRTRPGHKPNGCCRTMPITRLIHGICFAVGLWFAAPRISRELEDTSA